MATGFVQRFKGKIAAAALWFNGAQVFGPGAYVAYSTAGTQTIGAQALAKITASSAISIFTMSDLPAPGLEKFFDLAVTSGMFLKAASGASFDNSTNTVIKSTYNMRLNLMGLSSAKWAIMGVYPDTTAGGAPVGGITLSTTT